MPLDQTTITWIMGIVVTIGGLLINWQNSKKGLFKQDRDVLASDYTRVVKERDDALARNEKLSCEISALKEKYGVEKAELEQKLTERDVIISKLTIERMNHWKGRETQ